MYKTNGIPFVIKGHTRFFPPAADWLKGNGELDIGAMKLSIGKANVSVIDKQYNGEFKDSMTVTEYVDDHWLKGDKELYMHQYQFPLDTDPGTTLSIPFPIIPPCFSLTYSSLVYGQKSKRDYVANVFLVRCFVWICPNMDIPVRKTFQYLFLGPKGTINRPIIHLALSYILPYRISHIYTLL